MPSRVVELLADMVAIPSVNPRHAPEDAPTDGETTVAEYVARWAGRRRFDAELVTVTPGRRNVYVQIPGTLPGRVVLQTHTDTVEVDGMAHPFDLTGRDGRWYGRGACDAKGQLAVFLAATELAMEHDHHPVLLAACVDEEEDFRGVTSLCESEVLGPSAPDTIGAIVGEPTELSCVIAHRGVLRGTITATGPGGHSSRADEIDNPIATMAEAIGYLTGPFGAELRTRRHPLLGSPTLAVTTIRGGEAVNVVPRSVTITYDRRTLPDEEPERAWRDLADRLHSRWPAISVAAPSLTDSGLDTPADAPFVSRLRHALRTHGLDDTPVGAGFGSDASKIATLGIDCVVFGAGSITRAHTVDEFVPDRDLHRAVDVITACLTSP